jgi:transcription-repair coupling factor (superfamily II helicase)
MDEELYPFIVFFLIFIGWLFYLNTGGKNQKFYKKGETFKDEFGDYFVQDIEKLVTYVEALPKENQINIYEHLTSKFGNYEKETSKLNSPRKVKKLYEKNVADAAKTRRENADVNLGYDNPKWLAAALFESLLFSQSEKMSYNNGAKMRKYLFLKMKKLIPDNKSLKYLLTINSIK